MNDNLYTSSGFMDFWGPIAFVLVPVTVALVAAYFLL
jgi:hypothetical protein